MDTYVMVTTQQLTYGYSKFNLNKTVPVCSIHLTGTPHRKNYQGHAKMLFLKLITRKGSIIDVKEGNWYPLAHPQLAQYDTIHYVKLLTTLNKYYSDKLSTYSK